MTINENTKIEYLFRKKDGEEMRFTLTIEQIAGLKSNSYEQVKKMMKEYGENWEDWEIVGGRIVEG